MGSTEEVKALMNHVMSTETYSVGVPAHLTSLFDGCGPEGKEALISCLSSCSVVAGSKVVPVELLQSLGATHRATIVARALARARHCDPKVLDFIKELIAND